MIDIKVPENYHRQYFCRSMNKSFTVQAKDKDAEINIYDEIGLFGVSAAQMRKELDSLNGAENITVKINSPGGDVFDGIAIHNDLLNHSAKVHVKINGLAASAASIIAMAGDEIEISENGFIMIHNAWALAIGDKQVMDDMSDMLATIDEALVKTYAKRTGNTQKNVREWMNNETWLNAKDAKENGFVTSITGEEKVNAIFDLSVFNHVPAQLKRQIEAGLRDTGFSRREAKAAISQGFPQLDAASGHREDVKPTLLEDFVNQMK